MSDLIEAMANAAWNCGFHADDIADGEAERRKADWPVEWANAKRKATAALAALRETHHIIPKDREPVGEAYRSSNGIAMVRMTPDYTAEMQAEGYQPTPLYALEKRHD